MKRKKGILHGLIALIVIVFLIIGFTYGYVSSNIHGNTNENSVVVDLENSSIEYTDLSSSDTNKLIEPGFSDTKLFTVKNLGNTNVKYNIKLVSVVNTFARRNDLTYILYRKSGENSIDTTTYSGATIISEGVFPNDDMYIISGETLNQNDIYTYALKVTYENSQENQNVNKGAIFQSKIEINDTIDNPFEEGTLAYKILDNAINVTEEEKNNGYAEFNAFPITRPMFEYSKGVYQKNSDILYTEKKNNVTATNIYTYASDYTENSSGKFTLTGAQSGAYEDIYQDLVGKYIVEPAGATSQATSYNLSIIYKVLSTTETSLTYAYVNNVASVENELSVASDEEGNSYYFRGRPKNNYINFANMCWRIVRIEGDGSIKLKLASKDGKCQSENSLTNSSAVVGSGIYGSKTISGKNTINYDNNTISSMKYSFNIFLNGGTRGTYTFTGFSASDKAKLKEKEICIGDITNIYDSSYNILNETRETNIANSTKFYYKNLNRLLNKKMPSYICDEGALKTNSFKVFPLTADEIAFAGEGIHDITKNIGAKTFTFISQNSHKGTSGFYLSSISSFDGNSDRLLFLVNDLKVSTYIDYKNYSIINYGCAFVPAVNLVANIEYLSGDGSPDNPYEVVVEDIE